MRKKTGVRPASFRLLKAATTERGFRLTHGRNVNPPEALVWFNDWRPTLDVCCRCWRPVIVGGPLVCAVPQASGVFPACPACFKFVLRNGTPDA